jgi:drug/metabolite transporter (DMT)-like permease
VNPLLEARTSSARLAPDLALAFVSFIWGFTFVIVKNALGDISTFCFLALRFALAALCLLPLAVRGSRAPLGRAFIRGLPGGIVCGLFLWLGYVFQTAGLRYTTPARSAFLTCLYIVLVPPISAALARKAPNFSELAGLAIAAAGVFLLTIPRLDRSVSINPGDLLTLACSVAFALQVVAVGWYSERQAFEPVAFGQIAAAAVLSALCLPFEVPRVLWSPRVLLAIGVAGCFATALAFALQTWAQRRLTPTRTALIFSLEPVFALAAAVALTGEKLTAPSLAGCALILAGVVIVELRPLRRSHA